MFYRTTEVEGHYHIVYISDEDRTGRTSFDDEHEHSVFVDSEEGILIDEVGGHTHETEPMAFVLPRKKKGWGKPSDVVAEVRTLYINGKGTEFDLRRDGKESEGFYFGGKHQWNKDDLDDLEDRMVLTINEIQPKIDLLSGYQRQNRMDIRILPTEDGDARVADIYTALIKNITTRTKFIHEESEVFDDGAIAGRGFFHTYMDFDNNIEGDIVIEQFPWDAGYLGPHDRKDLSDCEYLVKSKWYSKAKIEQLYPKKAKQIGVDYRGRLPNEDIDTEHVQYTSRDQYDASENREDASDVMYSEADFVDVARKEYRLLECWRKEYKVVPVLFNIEDSVYESAESWLKEDVVKAATIEGFETVDQNVMEMRVTTIAGSVLLDDENPDLAVQDFDLTVFYANKRKNRVWGKVEPAKDPQREINFRHSQGADLLSRVEGIGWFHEPETFPSEEDAEEWKENSAKAGFTQEVTDITRPPVLAESVRFPSELVAYEQLASDKLREVMNIHLDISGLGSSSSGVALIERRKTGLVGNEPLFDNLRLAKTLLARKLIAMIQKHYTIDRIMRILNNFSEQKDLQIQGEKLDKYNPLELADLLRNVDVLKYDVVVGESPHSETNRQANFLMWAELARHRPEEVPLEFLVDLSDLPDKEAWKKRILEMNQARAAAEQQKNQNELIKAGRMNPDGTPVTAE